jgi:RNA polymerase primary sigma factor
VAGPRTSDDPVEAIRALADGLCFRVIELPDFRKSSYEPGRIRQPRTYIKPDDSMLAVGRFLVERGTVELLPPEHTQELFREMHWSGWTIERLARKRFAATAQARQALVQARGLVSRIEAAEEELFIANRRMVVSCVKPYYWIGQIWLGDFLQEGSKALANAIRKFDFTRGTPFFSYSQTAVQNRLRNFFRDHVRAGSFGIRPSREMILIKNLLDTWRRDYKEEPPVEALAKIADLPLERVIKLRQYVLQWEKMPPPPVSLDSEINEDGTELYELIEDTSVRAAASSAENSEIWQAIDKLPERSRYILKLRFLDGRTLEETGNLLKLTRARIKQIQDASLKKVRQMLGGSRARDRD